MNILVTGATGFMGSYLIPKLLMDGHNIRILVRDKCKAEKMFQEQCEILIGDITEPDSLTGCCDGIDVVYHMAALMGHNSPSEEAFIKFRKVNVDGVNNIIKEAKKSKIKKFIQISSTAALGLQNEVYITESTKCKPYTPYQVTKREGELLVIKEVNENQFPAIIVRPSMVYGPGFQGDFLTLAKVCKTGFFPKIGRGENLSPALYITDLADALACFVSGGRIGEIYFLSSSESYSLKQASEIIGRCMEKNIKYIYMPKWIAVLGAGILEKICMIIGKKPPVTQRNIKSVSQDRIIDVSKAKKDLGFEPKVSLAEGLTLTIDYFRKEQYI